MGCYFIDINPAALGADSILVRDFRGNTFTMPKKFSDLTPGRFGGSTQESRDKQSDKELFRSF